jgi:site-specific recombinase XerD
MTEVRSRFIRLLEMRGLVPKTITTYVLVIAEISRFFNKSPLLLTGEEICTFLLHRTKIDGLAPRTVNLYRGALRTFFSLMVPQGAVMANVPKMKTPKHLPAVLSRDEVDRLLAAIRNPKHKAMVTVLYSSGLRVSECAALKVADIDSKRMVIRVEQGKGRKDRYAVLSTRALELLRNYYRLYRPAYWLFEGQQRGGPHICTRSIEMVVEEAGRKAGIIKRISAHTLRHSFATHLLESGVQLPVIQRFLGHASIRTTNLYTQVSSVMLHSVKSPFDTEPAGPAPAPALAAAGA